MKISTEIGVEDSNFETRRADWASIACITAKCTPTTLVSRAYVRNSNHDNSILRRIHNNPPPLSPRSSTCAGAREAVLILDMKCRGGTVD